MKVDVLQFLAMPDQSLNKSYSRQTHSLGNSVDIITPIDASGYGQWKHVKNLRGWPWDLKLYDEMYVYDWITEGANGWSADPAIGPRSFKKFVRNHRGTDLSFQDGLIMFPRYVDSQDARFTVTLGDGSTNYATFENCLEVGKAQSLGPVRQHLSGPFTIYHGGDVGIQPTLIHQYYWSNNGVPTLEENHYALNWGWVAWKLHTLNKKTGFYELQKETLEIDCERVNEVKIVFPCF